MKRLIILLFLLPLLAHGQINLKNPNAWKTFGIYSGSIILNGIGDGLKDSHEKGLGHMANICSISLMILSPFIIDYHEGKWYDYLLTYGSLRIAYFDWTYNLTRGLPLTYYGNTSAWDKYFMQGIKPPDGFALGRGVAFIVGFTIPFNITKK